MAAEPAPAALPRILHVDMDAFFAAVEVLDDPSLAGRAVIVGGTGRRGVVAAASYEARAHGVHSAMPSVEARRRCPHAVFLPGRHTRYAEVSAQVFELFESVTPLVEGISLDEAFLDVAAAVRRLGPPPAIAAAVRRRVHDELGLSCSVGVAASKLVAKLASEAAKPRPSPRGPRPGPGVFVVEPGHELAFLHPLPVRALWGVGPATHERLARFGVHTVGDLARLGEDTLVRLLGAAHGRHLHALAWAIDDRPVEPHRAAKSIGHEETFPVDHTDPALLHREVVRLADAVGARVRSAGVVARTITLKVRFAGFRTITRSVTVPDGVSAGRDVVALAGDLLASVDVSPGVRLLGVHASGLGDPGARQLRLDETGPEPWAAATGAVDEIRARFGAGAIGPVSAMGKGGHRPVEKGAQAWGPGDENPQHGTKGIR